MTKASDARGDARIQIRDLLFELPVNRRRSERLKMIREGLTHSWLIPYLEREIEDQLEIERKNGERYAAEM